MKLHFWATKFRFLTEQSQLLFKDACYTYFPVMKPEKLS